MKLGWSCCEEPNNHITEQQLHANRPTDMHFTNILPAFAALAAALPQPNPDMYENIDISDFTIRKNQGPDQTKINVVSFKLSGENATDLTCEKSNPALPSDVITCGESKYRFALKEGTDDYEFALDLYHELGLA